MDPIPTRTALLRRIRDPEDHQGWQEFVETYGGLIRRIAFKSGLLADEVEDVVQDVFVSVSRNIGDFTYDPSKCSFKSWLSVLVRWRIRDRIRRRLPVGEPRADSGGETDLLEQEAVLPELESIWDQEWQRNQIEVATARVKESVPLKQFQIYYLSVLNNQPAAEVARRLNVNRAQVYLARLRVGQVFRRVLQRIQDDEGG